MESKEVSGAQTIAYRNYRRARDRALVRLSHDYPEQYRQYLEEEKVYDENEGVKWVKSSHRNTFIVGVRSSGGKSSDISTTQTQTNTNESNHR